MSNRSALPKSQHGKTIDMSHNSTCRRIHARPVEQVPRVHLEQTAVVEMLLDPVDVAIDVIENFPGEGEIARELKMLLRPAHPQERPGREKVLPAAGDLRLNNGRAIEASPGQAQAMRAESRVAIGN